MLLDLPADVLGIILRMLGPGVNILRWVCRGLLRRLTTYSRHTYVGCASTVPLMQWVIGQGYVPDIETLIAMVCEGHLDVLQWMLKGHVIPSYHEKERMYIAAGQHCRLHVLEWLWTHKYRPASKEIASWAAFHGRQDIIDWVLRSGVPYSEKRICRWAASGGHLAMLKWARSVNMPWDGTVVTMAVRHMVQHPEASWVMLEWLHEQGAPMTSEAFANTAHWGRLDILQWLHERGCAWSMDVYHYAVRLDIRAWARSIRPLPPGSRYED